MVKYFIYAIGAYLGTWLFIQLSANNIIYQPPKPSTYKDNQHIIKIDMDDGTRLSAVYLPNPSAKYTILYLHGNAGDLGDLQNILRYFQHNGYAIMSYDYPGYGTSTGKPSEQNLYQSAQRVYDYMINTLKIQPSTIIAYGQSLGAAVALDLAIHKNLAAVVMESPFLSAFRTYTQIPLFPSDKYINTTKINQLTAPLLVIHGKSDYEIMFWQGRSLYRRARSPKAHYWVQGATHDNILVVAADNFWVELKKFVDTFLTLPKSR